MIRPDLAPKGQISRRGLLLSTATASLISSRHLSAHARPLLTRPQRYEVVVIADNDSNLSSRMEGNGFASYLAHFTINAVASNGSTAYNLDTQSLPKVSQVLPGAAPATLPGRRVISQYSYGGRGGELSDLLLLPAGGSSENKGQGAAAGQRLLAFDDRTGIIFELLPTGIEPALVTSTSVDNVSALGALAQGLQAMTQWLGVAQPEKLKGVSLVPRWILPTGPGNTPIGFKCEWSALQGGKVVVGSHGYEVWSQGPPYIIGQGARALQWVKVVDPLTGLVEHRDWATTYNAIAAALRVVPPGYVVHEAAAWSDVHGRWFFMPRKISPAHAWDQQICHSDQSWDPHNHRTWSQDPVTDGQSGANVLVSCKEGGGDVVVVQLQGLTSPDRGFSAMRFVPSTNDTHIIATKTVERLPGQPCETYVTVVAIDGQVLLPETQISDQIKFEGLEILPMPL